MIANCPGCAPAAADVREPSRARARLPWLALLPAILYALAPKCPLWLVAYLSAFGVTFVWHGELGPVRPPRARRRISGVGAPPQPTCASRPTHAWPSRQVQDSVPSFEPLSLERSARALSQGADRQREAAGVNSAKIFVGTPADRRSGFPRLNDRFVAVAMTPQGRVQPVATLESRRSSERLLMGTVIGSSRPIPASRSRSRNCR